MAGAELVSDDPVSQEALQRSKKRRRLSYDETSSHSSEGAQEQPTQSQTQSAPVASRIKPRKEPTHNSSVPIEPLKETEISNGKVVDKRSSFGTLDVAPWLLVSLAAMEVKRPTAIQKACIPEILDGKDVIGGSKTGSGKTIAFAVPMLQRLAENPCGVFGLVLTPTRELALQIYEQFMAISYRFELKATLITGGADWVAQTRSLKEKPHIVIATPGRLADHIRSSGTDTIIGLRRVKILVLDEADRLLAEDAGMLPDMETCLDSLPSARDRQTCLFTATMTPEVLALRDRPREKGSRPVSVCEVDLGDALAVPASLHLAYVMIPVQYRDAYLHVLLQTPRNITHKSVIVFTNKTSTANVMERLLRALGHSVTSLHSKLPQKERTANLARFRAGAARVLVATDVASRGLDIPEVSIVINYDVPAFPDDYVHRAGRTARAGRSGEAVTLVGPRDEQRVKAIELRVGRDMVEYTEDAVNLETRVVRDSLKAVGEAKREVLIGIEEGRDSKGNRAAGKITRLA